MLLISITTTCLEASKTQCDCCFYKVTEWYIFCSEQFHYHANKCKCPFFKIKISEASNTKGNKETISVK